MKRNEIIDILKGLCILLVVIGHFVPDYSPESYQSFVELIYSFHMPAFMWASGFLYVKTCKIDRSYVDFQISKAKRLLLPYVVVSIIVITLKLLTQGVMTVDHPVTPKSYLKIFYRPEAGYFLWFVWALVLMFLIVPFFNTPRKRVALFVGSILFSILPFNYPDVFCFEAFIRFLPFFSLGLCCADIMKLKHYKVSSHAIGGIAVLVLVLLVASFLLIPSGFVIKELIVGVIGIAAVVLVSVIISKGFYSRKWILLMGESSFIIYLFHTTFQGLAKGLLGKIYEEHFFLGELVIVVASGIILSIILQKLLLERTRIFRYIFSLKCHSHKEDCKGSECVVNR